MTHPATSHHDTFARDNLPPEPDRPVFVFDRPELQYPDRINCAVELLDRMVAKGFGDKTLFYTPSEVWSYRRLLSEANRIARVLVEDLGLIAGNRVLIRSANNPRSVAAWFGIVKAGGIVVSSMPLLRAGEIAKMLDKACIRFAVCDERLGTEMEKAQAAVAACERVIFFNGSGHGAAGAELEQRSANKPATFDNVATWRDDVAMIAFTSGSTGKPKATMHFHRDVMAICDCFPRSVLGVRADDRFIGSPPLAFTFGLGGLVLFPMRYGASSVLLEQAAPDNLLEAIEHFRPSVCFTAPTAYHRMLQNTPPGAFASLTRCVSAGENLPVPIFKAWQTTTGLRIINGIGATEMLHIFISAAGDQIRPGATGLPVPGYQARLIDDHSDDHRQELPPGEIGELMVRGPTGCRYLADDRQRDYVRDGWNITGDLYWRDDDGYFWFFARSDDIIISSGYNISAAEVEQALLAHPAVAETAVIGVPDAQRGHLVKALVVRQPQTASDQATLAQTLQDFVKQQIAPYKYPRIVEFVDALPKTESGKIKRFALRDAKNK